MAPSTTTIETTTCQNISTKTLSTDKFLKSELIKRHASNIPNDYIKPKNLKLKINGKWLNLSKDFVAKHPGGSVINQYK